jgi:hypothetical protein
MQIVLPRQKPRRSMKMSDRLPRPQGESLPIVLPRQRLT